MLTIRTAYELRGYVLTRISELFDLVATDGSKVQHIEADTGEWTIRLTTDPEETVDEMNTAGSDR
jgi:hypothetical protein